MNMRPLTGVVPLMVTPLRARDELDVPGLERLNEHILAGITDTAFPESVNAAH